MIKKMQINKNEFYHHHDITHVGTLKLLDFEDVKYFDTCAVSVLGAEQDEIFNN